MSGRQIEIAFASGRLRIVIRPTRLAGIFAVAFDLFFVCFLSRFWHDAAPSMRVFGVLVVIGVIVGGAYEISAEETIGFDAQNLTVRKSIGAWRTREIKIALCSRLEWHRGQKGGSHLACDIGGTWTEKFANRISEADAERIMILLQRNLPDVAEKLSVSRDSKEHFIRLGLNKTLWPRV